MSKWVGEGQVLDSLESLEELGKNTNSGWDGQCEDKHKEEGMDYSVEFGFERCSIWCESHR